MADHCAWRLELARAYIEPYAERAPIAVLGGSRPAEPSEGPTARGEA